MKITYAGKIAWTKFKARKIRTIISAIITAIMLVILISLSLGYTGNRNVLKATPGLASDRALARLYGGGAVMVVDDEGNNIDPLQSLTLERAQNMFDGYNITNVYAEKQLFSLYPGQSITVENRALFADPEGQLVGYGDFLELSVRDDSLLLAGLSEGQEINVGEDGSIPIFVNADVVRTVEGVTFDGTTEQRVNAMAALVRSYTGKKLVFGIEGSNVSIAVRVVGYTPRDTLLSSIGASMYVPSSVLNDAVKQNLEAYFSALQSQMNVGDNQSGIPEMMTPALFDEDFTSPPIIEFASVADLKRFQKDKSCGIEYSEDCIEAQIVQNALLEFDEQIGLIWGFLKYVVGFFFIVTAIFLFFTTSKVIGDSRKETGVFRAMGAKRLDIALIYFLYTVIITVLAFCIAVIISLALMAIVTTKQGPELSVIVTSITGNYADPVSMTFIGFNLVHLFAILLLSIVVGLIGGIFPIARNVTIDPIKAMRSE